MPAGGCHVIPFDLMRFAYDSLVQHKLRSVLTLLGVVLGAFLVIITISIGQGVQEVIPRLMRQNDRMRRIEVHQAWEPDESGAAEEPIAGAMSPERRSRLQEASKQRAARNSGKMRVLGDELLAEVAALDHVEAVVPSIQECAEFRFQDHLTAACFVSASADSRENSKLVAGRAFESNGAAEVLIHELQAYDLGFQNEADLTNLLGKTLRIERSVGSYHLGSVLVSQSDGTLRLTPEEKRQLDDVVRSLPTVAEQVQLPDELQQLLKKALGAPSDRERRPPPEPVIVATEDLTIVGIFRTPTENELRDMDWRFGGQSDLIVPVDVARAFARQAPGFEKQGYQHVVIKVDEERHVRSIVDSLRKRRYACQSLVDIVEHLQRQNGLILWSMTALGMAALLISALGITNTMLMSVLERTREIGVMKAVGAQDGQIRAIFLTEGALIGFCGAGTALALAWGVSKFANSWIQAIIAREANMPVDDQIFLFPWWLIAGIFVVTLAVTFVAAWLPARRAARIPPVVALRHV
jgi:putative ABC transport system permease protein